MAGDGFMKTGSDNDRRWSHCDCRDTEKTVSREKRRQRNEQVTLHVT